MLGGFRKGGRPFLRSVIRLYKGLNGIYAFNLFFSSINAEVSVDFEHFCR
jgi:hypothetical protein